MFSPLNDIEITARTMSDFTVGFLGAGMMASAVMVCTRFGCGSLVVWYKTLSTYLALAAIGRDRMV
jgi:hypothetical protein